MKKYLHFQLLTILLFNIVFYGCKKKEEEDYDTQSSGDHAHAEGIFDQLGTIADQASTEGQLTTVRNSPGWGNHLTSCATVTLNVDSTGSGTAAIDFGSSFCLGNDGRYRKGLVDVSFTGAYRDSGTVITINASNYFIGYDSTHATKVNGTRVVTNRGRNTAGHTHYSVEANATIVNYLSQEMTWHSTRQREWTKGDTTTAWSDDEYLVTGSADGKSFGGVNFTVNITEALHIKLSCRWIVGGKFDLTPSGKAARTFAFGDGVCDADATVTIGDKTYQLILN